MIKPYFVRPNGEDYDVIETATGRVLVSQEGFTIADGVAWCLNHPDAWSGSEACEVADAIREREAA